MANLTMGHAAYAQCGINVTLAAAAAAREAAVEVAVNSQQQRSSSSFRAVWVC